MSDPKKRRHITVGVDPLKPSLLALAWAADEAVQRHLAVRLLLAVPKEEHKHTDVAHREVTPHHLALRKRGADSLASAASFVRARHPDLELTTHLIDGSPALSLCHESAKAHMIVLGTRRLSRAEEILSGGSIVVPVSAQADCPVVVVGDPEHITQEPPYLVVGVDGSVSSRAAVAQALEEASLRGATLRAVWAWPRPVFSLGDESAGFNERRRLLSESTAGWADKYSDVPVTHEVVRGHPVEELARSSEHALSVVVGRRGRGGYTGMRLGSVVHGLLHRAVCPVITVPTPPGN
ncbi:MULTISPECIES: universal stress protein [unclassified Streptomyces]|uniref:universal stress protein n=1 Tax=unclassified Streptomyces TaxID=2593676 RepID=UPI002DD7E485|nr:universal stress protein [Streptomyces sp. NBC_01750]WSB04392.1 universal stress protein [Streptomyces sp. NBC_01794]WSD31326.1 universal stress protein [Streptomyces sp. NBC_01750]